MEPEKKSNGALIGAIIIIIILIAGGVYVWQSKVKTVIETKEQTENVSPNDSDELNTLDQELETTDTNIDANVINNVE